MASKREGYVKRKLGGMRPLFWFVAIQTLLFLAYSQWFAPPASDLLMLLSAFISGWWFRRALVEM